MSLDIRGAHGVTAKKTPAPTTQTFISSGTWTKPAGAKRVLVQCWGGGGGGCSSVYDTGGGAGGSHASRMFNASEVSASVPVTVAAGGNGGSNTNSQFYPWNQGASGGISSFGSYVTAKGGGGGYGSGQSSDLTNRDGLLQGAPDGIQFWNRQESKMMTLTNQRIDGYHIGGSGGGKTRNTSTGTWDQVAAGTSVYGGGGGGSNDYRAQFQAGGVSTFGGNGGTSTYIQDQGYQGAAGSIPAGGGAASSGPYTGGKGARGEVRVTTYYA